MSNDPHCIDLDLGLEVEPGGSVGRERDVADLVARWRTDLTPTRLDLGTTRGRTNVAQAVILRVMTRVKELAALGHPEYGSRHHDLIGESNLARTRDLVRLHLLDALGREPRIAAVEDLEVDLGEGLRGRSEVRLRASLHLVGMDEPVRVAVGSEPGGR